MGPSKVPKVPRYLGFVFFPDPPGAESRVGAMSDLSPGLKLPLIKNVQTLIQDGKLLLMEMGAFTFRNGRIYL